MLFKVASFNINSIRARLPILMDWLVANQPDVLCLQETKVPDDKFPTEEIEAAGYHVAYKGQKSYNGVAIISRHPITDVCYEFGFAEDNGEARFIQGVVQGIPVVNTYIPQGQAVDSPKFAYKLAYIQQLGEYFKQCFKPEQPLLWMGDFNVAPLPLDVHDPKRLLGRVCFHPEEHRVLAGVKEWGFVDVFRKHQPEGGNFSFWDYRVRQGVERNIGWRIDHIWASDSLANQSHRAWIDKEPRMLPKPSDHTPILAEFNLPD